MKHTSTLQWTRAAVLAVILTASTASAATTFHTSPNGGTAAHICQLCDNSQTEILVAAYTLTNPKIADALIHARARGLRVDIACDRHAPADNGSQLARLQAAGCTVGVSTLSRKLHDKMALFDRRITLCGSFNWSEKADKVNSESTLTTDDPDVATAALAHLTRLARSCAPLPFAASANPGSPPSTCPNCTGVPSHGQAHRPPLVPQRKRHRWQNADLR